MLYLYLSSVLILIVSTIILVVRRVIKCEEMKFNREAIVVSYIGTFFISTIYPFNSLSYAFYVLANALNFGLFSVLTWRLITNEDKVMRIYLYYLMSIPLQLFSHIFYLWEVGFISNLSAVLMSNTGLMFIIFCIAMIKKHYLGHEVVRVLYMFYLALIVALSIEISEGLLDSIVPILTGLVIQIPLYLFIRMLYKKRYKNSSKKTVE